MANGISIIILSHNNKSIQIVLSQVLSQTSPWDEVIVVDDYSTADVISTLKQYEAQATNITLLHAKKHGNRSYNRNIGASCAKRDWLLFMDGDIVLADQALETLRNAICFSPCIGFSGPLHGTRYSEEALLLYSGINDYQKLLTTPQGRRTIIDDVRLADKRTNTFLSEKYRRYRWALFFSGCCAVKKDMFQLVGGFDEEFIGWGAEDVDLGYRLSLYGDIQFLPEFHGIHIPHPRDIFRVNSQNHANMYYMLSKYRSWEFELLIVARGSLPIFTLFLDLITQMRQLPLPPADFCKIPGSITINVFSKQTPLGSVTCCFEDGKIAQFNLFGMALPLAEQSMKIAFVSQNIWTYPENVCCEVLRESLRVAEEVYLCGPLPEVRLCHREMEPLSGPAFRFAFSIQDIMEFKFEPIRDNLVRITSKTHDLLSPLPIIPEELDQTYLTELTERLKDITKCYDVVDCCYNGGSRILLADFMRKSGLEIGHMIQPNPKICCADHFAPEDELITALITHTQPLLFLIPSLEEVPAIVELWHIRNYSADIMCGMNGYIKSACLD